MSDVENPSVPVFRLRVEQVPDDHARLVRFLGPWRSCNVHWVPKGNKGRTVPCAGRGECEKSIHVKEIQWRAYAPAEWWKQGNPGVWVPCVQEITDTLGQFLRDRTLLGELWELFRQKSEGKYKECAGRFVQVDRPPPYDTRNWVEAVCYRLWGHNRVEWGVEPVIPPAITLQGREAPPPPQTRTRTEREQPTATAEEWAQFRAKLRDTVNGKGATR